MLDPKLALQIADGEQGLRWIGRLRWIGGERLSAHCAPVARVFGSSASRSPSPR